MLTSVRIFLIGKDQLDMVTGLVLFVTDQSRNLHHESISFIGQESCQIRKLLLEKMSEAMTMTTEDSTPNSLFLREREPILTMVPGSLKVSLGRMFFLRGFSFSEAQ